MSGTAAVMASLPYNIATSSMVWRWIYLGTDPSVAALAARALREGVDGRVDE
jgi:hypothetical protein